MKTRRVSRLLQLDLHCIVATHNFVACMCMLHVYACMQNHFRNPVHILSEELLRDAAKARLRRMVTPKKRRGDLEVPPFVLKEWNKGSLSRDDMADLLLQHNGNKDTAAAHSACACACRHTWIRSHVRQYPSLTENLGNLSE